MKNKRKRGASRYPFSHKGSFKDSHSVLRRCQFISLAHHQRPSPIVILKWFGFYSQGVSLTQNHCGAITEGRGQKGPRTPPCARLPRLRAASPPVLTPRSGGPTAQPLLRHRVSFPGWRQAASGAQQRAEREAGPQARMRSHLSSWQPIKVTASKHRRLFPKHPRELGDWGALKWPSVNENSPQRQFQEKEREGRPHPPVCSKGAPAGMGARPPGR